MRKMDEAASQSLISEFSAVAQNSLGWPLSDVGGSSQPAAAFVFFSLTRLPSK